MKKENSKKDQSCSYDTDDLDLYYKENKSSGMTLKDIQKESLDEPRMTCEGYLDYTQSITQTLNDIHGL